MLQKPEKCSQHPDPIIRLDWMRSRDWRMRFTLLQGRKQRSRRPSKKELKLEVRIPFFG